MDTISADFEALSQDYRCIERAILYLAEHYPQQPGLDALAAHVGLSEFHFQRMFTRWAGISPKRFLQFLTKEGAKRLLRESTSLLQAAYQVGLSSPGRLHDLFIAAEAVTPGEYKSRGVGLQIRYGFHPTPFGECLIGVSERGICHLSFVDAGRAKALAEFTQDWPEARLSEDPDATAPLVAPIFHIGSQPGRPLHLHVRGTNFQLKVWEALLSIPPGAVTTYEQVAQTIANPAARRAVGHAVARNPIAVLIPCHRVIRKAGEFGNYRYGVGRKMALIGWEAARQHTEQMSTPALKTQ